MDDQKGNLVLDYGANCISGCANGTVSAGNVANGSDSTNTAESSNITNNNTFQSNDGTVENTLILMADSGKNDSSKNNSRNDQNKEEAMLSFDGIKIQE